MDFYTIGYSKKELPDFINLLKENNIKTVVDVRLRPDKTRLRSYVKAKDKTKGIENSLLQAGINYVSFVELGNIFMDFIDWKRRYNELLDKMGDSLIERLSEVGNTFCLMCVEADVNDCHRKYISDYLIKNDYNLVKHL